MKLRYIILLAVSALVLVLDQATKLYIDRSMALHSSITVIRDFFNITYLRNKGDMAIVLVEQYFDFAKELAQRIAVMDRGDIVLQGAREELDEHDVRRRLSV